MAPSSRQPSGVFVARCLDLGKIEPRGAFGMCERQLQRTVGDLAAATPASAPRCRSFRSARRRARRSRDRAPRPARARTPPSKCRSRPRRRRARHSSSAIGSASQPSSANCFQTSRAEAERIVRHLAAMIGVVALGHEAFGALAQQPLLVAEIEIHCTTSRRPACARRDAVRTDRPPCRIPEDYGRGRADAAQRPGRSRRAGPSRRPSGSRPPWSASAQRTALLRSCAPAPAPTRTVPRAARPD